MRNNEREILRRVKAANREGRGYNTLLTMSHAWHNAFERLQAKGLMAFRGYRETKVYSLRGYWAATHWQFPKTVIARNARRFA